MGVQTVGGVTGSPEAMAEAAAIFGIDPADLADAPESTLTRVRRVASVRRRQREKSPEEASAEAERAIPREKSADERRIEEFERKCVPVGKFQGKCWADVPVGFVQWFAKFDWQKSEMRALQVRVREYLELKYGISVGQLF